MADIKLTLNKDDPIYARDVEKETNWMSQEGKLWYALHTEPKHAHLGCWVYFILDGQLRARAKAVSFVETSIEEDEYTYSGHKRQRKKWSRMLLYGASNTTYSASRVSRVPVCHGRRTECF